MPPLHTLVPPFLLVKPSSPVSLLRQVPTLIPSHPAPLPLAPICTHLSLSSPSFAGHYSMSVHPHLDRVLTPSLIHLKKATVYTDSRMPSTIVPLHIR